MHVMKYLKGIFFCRIQFCEGQNGQISAEFSLADEQFSYKNFAHFEPLIRKRKRKQKPKESSASQSEASEVTQVKTFAASFSKVPRLAKKKVVPKEPELINLVMR